MKKILILVRFMISNKFTLALSTIYEKFKDQNIKWVIVGSASLALHSVKVNPHDIDIMTDKEGAKKINAILKEYEIKPIVYGKTERFESHLGEFKINNVKIEVMGELREKIKNKWISLDNRLDNHTKIKFNNMTLPVSNLNEQYLSYKDSERRKDFVRTRKIKEFFNCTN